jgi:PAS domain S-box-containing protein
MQNPYSRNMLKDPDYRDSDRVSMEPEKTLYNEQRFRQAIEDSLPSGIAVMDESGRQIYVNNTFCQLVGWSAEELNGMTPPFIYWASEDTDNINRALELTLNNNAPPEGFKLLFRHKSGMIIPVKVLIRPFMQEDNKTFWLANVIDETEQQIREDALKDSEILLSSTMESLRDTIIFALDRDYRYLVFNKAHSEGMKFAYGTNIKKGSNMLDYITVEKERNILKANFDRAMAGESISFIQTFGDMNIGYYEVFVDPIRNEKNEIIGCSSAARNISQRKQIEQDLKESETKFREILDQIYDAIIVFDEKGKIVIWNKGSEKLSGIKASDAINKNMADIYARIMPPENRNMDNIENTIQDIINLRNPELFNTIADHEIVMTDAPFRRKVQSNTFPIHFDGYNLFCSVIRDVTEKKRYESELLRISQDKDKFYSALAQYIYTPFSTLHNFTKVMTVEMDSLPIKELQKMAIMMRKSASNLYSLLDNLLQWTKMNQGKIHYSPEKLDFTNTSQDALSILKSNAESKNIRISLTENGNISVYADPFMLKTILRNIVLHLIRCMQEEGDIKISAVNSSPKITVAVSYNGKGLLASDLSAFFSTQEINTAITSAEEKGTALGLWLTKEFVEKNGGNIWVEREEEYPAIIKFTLPSSEII